MLGALPKVVDLGLQWATLDDGWFAVQGDGEVRVQAGRAPAIAAAVPRLGLVRVVGRLGRRLRLQRLSSAKILEPDTDRRR